jgi:hypothetical protein
MGLPRLFPCPSPSAQRGEHRRAAVFFFLLDAGSSAKLPGGERLWLRIYLSCQREVASWIRRNPRPHAESSFRPRPARTGNTTMQASDTTTGARRHISMGPANHDREPLGDSRGRRPPIPDGGRHELGRCRLHEFAAIVASGGQVRSGQHQQSGKEGPEHQAH